MESVRRIKGGSSIEDLYSKNIFLELIGLPLQSPLDGEAQEPAMTL